MQCSGKREIRGEVRKEWMESIQEWQLVKMKEVEVVKREGVLANIQVHMSKRSSFEVIDQTIRCTEGFQSFFIDREFAPVCFLFITISPYYISV